MNTHEVLELISEGYCSISRKYQIVSRIDIVDWREYMAKEHTPWDIQEGLDWVYSLGDVGAADQYRRVYSKDKLVFFYIEKHIFYMFPKSSSSNSPTEYLE